MFAVMLGATVSGPIAHEERIAVRGGLRGGVAARNTACTGPVLRDDGLARSRADMLRGPPSLDIAGTARRE